MELFLDFVFWLGFFINIVILYLFFKSKEKGYHKKILFVIFLIVLCTLLSFYAILHEHLLLFYSTFIVQDGAAILIGPLLLLYVKSIFLSSKSLLRKNAKYFVVPFIYFTFFTIPYFISMYTDEYLFEYLRICDDFISVINAYSVICCFISLYILNRIQHVILHYHSNTDSVDLGWIKKLLIGVLTIIGVDLLFTLGELFWGELSWNSFFLISIGIVFLLGYLGYHGLAQSRVLLPMFLFEYHFPKETQKKTETFISKKEGIRSKYDKSEMKDLGVLLKNLIEKEELFLEPDLSLGYLAELLSTSDKKISTLLNQHMNISFYNYINGYRVKEVMRKLNDPTYDNITLLAIAYECGFNSKTSFNRIFRNMVGISPSEFKKQAFLKNKKDQ